MYSTSSSSDIARNRLKPFPAAFNLKTQIAPNSFKQLLGKGVVIYSWKPLQIVSRYV